MPGAPAAAGVEDSLQAQTAGRAQEADRARQVQVRAARNASFTRRVPDALPRLQGAGRGQLDVTAGPQAHEPDHCHHARRLRRDRCARADRKPPA